MCPIRRNSLLVHVSLPQILGTNGLVVVVVVYCFFSNQTPTETHPNSIDQLKGKKIERKRIILSCVCVCVCGGAGGVVVFYFL